MIRRLILSFLIIACLVPAASAHGFGFGHGFHPGFFGFPSSGGFFFGSPFFGPRFHHRGVFFGPRFFGPRFLGPFGSAGLADPDGRFGYPWGAGRGGFFAGPGAFSTTENLSAGFIQRWIDEEPEALRPEEEAPPEPLTGSTLLKEGLSDVEVVARVGMPLSKASAGAQEIWRYSSFKLVFEEGKLKGVR